MSRRRKRRTVEDDHFFKPRPGVTIEVRLYDEIWNKFYDERASVSDEGQMRRLVSDLVEKGVLLDFACIRKV